MPCTRTPRGSCWRSRPERDEERDHGVERVHAALGIRRRVRRAPSVAELELAIAEEEPVRAPHAGGVGHQRDVDVGEGAGLDEPPLAEPDLLRRAADHVQAQRVGGQHRCERGCGEQRRRPREAVPAGVADLRQRVHLREQGDAQRRRVAAVRRDEGGVHPGDGRLDAKRRAPLSQAR